MSFGHAKSSLRREIAGYEHALRSPGPDDDVAQIEKDLAGARADLQRLEEAGPAPIPVMRYALCVLAIIFLLLVAFGVIH